MHEKNTEFDLLVRSMLQDAEEPVSPRVWDAVSGHLDKADARRRALLWWRRTAIAVAAAAAVALGVFFAGTTDNSNTQQILTNPTRSALVTPPVPSRTETQEAGGPAVTSDRPETRRMADARSRGIASVPTEVTAPGLRDYTADADVAAEGSAAGGTAGTETPPVRETQPASVVPVTPAAPRGTEKTEGIDGAGDAKKLLDLQREESASRSRIAALSLGGNLQTNGNPAPGFAGIRAAQGLTKPTTGIQELSKESVYGAPVSFGAGIRFDFNDRWSLGTGLTYSLLSRSFTGTYTEVDGNGDVVMSLTSDIRNMQHYLGIPVNFYFNVVSNPNLKFYAWAGGTFEKNLLNRFTIANSPVDIIYRQPVSGIQISAGAGLGVEFMLGQYVGLYVDPSLRYYFNCYQPKSIRTQQPLMLNLEVGLRFNVGR